MTCEFWVAYYFVSRGNAAPTSQLIDLEQCGQKLCDLEDVLDYVFRQGYIECRFRPVTTWARKDGAPVHPSDTLDELLKQGVGKCADSAIKVLVEDAPTSLWFTYYYVYSPDAKASTQRVRLNQETRFEHLAHVTNYVFNQGYIPGHYRPVVHWEARCGKKLAEDSRVVDILIDGFGVSDCEAIKLIIDAHQCHQHHSHHRCSCEHNHHCSCKNNNHCSCKHNNHCSCESHRHKQHNGCARANSSPCLPVHHHHHNCAL